MSYGHADMKETNWVERLRDYLEQNRHSNGIVTWDDSKIKAGMDWQQSIASALNDSKAAILLVGPSFLGSEFVANHELPQLLASARNRAKPTFPLVVKHCAYRQSVLKSIQAFNDPDRPLESLSTLAEQNKIMNSLAVALNERIEMRPARDQFATDLVDEISIVKAIQRKLSDTLTAFVAQVHRRDELVEMIEKRLRFRNTLEFEKFFFKYYDQLTPDERFVFDQIRALTDGALHVGNREIADLLERHPVLLKEIPALVALRQHLVFWLNKYDRIFDNQPRMCLLYAGVEDAVPFPDGIDGVISRWLKRKES